LNFKTMSPVRFSLAWFRNYDSVMASRWSVVIVDAAALSVSLSASSKALSSSIVIWKFTSFKLVVNITLL